MNLSPTHQTGGKFCWFRAGYNQSHSEQKLVHLDSQLPEEPAAEQWGIDTAAILGFRGRLIGQPGLTGAQYGVFQRLGRCEAQPRARRNLNLCSGGRVAAHACLGPALAENSQAGKP